MRPGEALLFQCSLQGRREEEVVALSIQRWVVAQIIFPILSSLFPRASGKRRPETVDCDQRSTAFRTFFIDHAVAGPRLRGNARRVAAMGDGGELMYFCKGGGVDHVRTMSHTQKKMRFIFCERAGRPSIGEGEAC